jgi:pimeloyl-ACP methyl ester carboxylesterase
MDTLFTKSLDGTQIAYDCIGTGPALMLVHGGGTTRHDWYEGGYVDRLKDKFTVITFDVRGHGESGLPTDPAKYTTDKMGQDILAVADACKVDHFIIWGMSYGGKVSRYLAVQSDRVTKLILMGTPLGLGVSGKRRQQAVDFRARWDPVVRAQRNGALDPTLLSQPDQEFMENFNVAVMLAWVTAMLDWPEVTPADFRCPTLWLVGSEDEYAMATFKEYEDDFKGSLFHVHILDGLDHDQVFDEIDKAFPIMLTFTQSE